MISLLWNRDPTAVIIGIWRDFFFFFFFFFFFLLFFFFGCRQIYIFISFLFRLIGLVDEACLPSNAYGRLITTHLLWVHVCLSEHFWFCLCIYRLYDFPEYDFGMFTSDLYLYVIECVWFDYIFNRYHLLVTSPVVTPTSTRSFYINGVWY